MDAQTVWFKNKEEIGENEEKYKVYSEEGENILEFLSPDASDIGKYTCKIIKFGKEGEDETSCFLNIIGKRKSHPKSDVSFGRAREQICAFDLISKINLIYPRK